MALVLQDRVQENSTSSGTGNITLGGAYPGYRTFSSCIPTGSIVYYCIHNTANGYDTEWEVGYGTYTLSTNELSRDNVYSSSNANALVNFTSGAGGLQVFITYPSEQAVFQQTTGLTEFNEGPISVVGANATPGTFPATLAQFFSNEPGYSQLYVQNQSNDANASSDIVAYNNLGDGVSYFVDMGINSSTYNSVDYPIFQANDAYLFNAGNVAGTGAAGDISRLMIGTSTANSNVVIFGGSVNIGSEIATFVASSKNVNFANNISVTSNVTANNAQFTNFVYSGANLSNAANSTVLVTQAYVDNAVAAGIDIHDPVNLATTTALTGTPTYNQPGGAGVGVGATLTASGVGTLSVDGKNAAFGYRILVQSQANQVQNGVYTVTTEGTGGAAYVLTRATDSDTSTELSQGSYYYTLDGNTLKGDAFVVNTTGTVNFGTTNITFALFSSPSVYTGTSPINVTNTTISLDTVPVANGGTNLTTYTTGDVIYANATNTLTKRSIGASSSVLVSNGSVPDWGTVALGSGSAVSGTLGTTNGGTGQNTYTLGDIIYSNATNTLAKLPGQITTTQKFLSQTGDGVNSAAPVWDTVSASSITGLGTMASQNANAVTITGGTLNNVVIGGTTANAATFTTANATTFNGSGSGLTSLNGSNVSSGTIDNARTTAATANGASTIVLRDGTGNFAANTITANLSGTASTATTAVTATTANNIAGGAAGSVPYQSAANTTVLLATGSGVLVGGTTPAWSTAPTLTGTNFSGIPNGATTASAANGASTIVARDINGSFTANNINATTFAGGGSALSSLNAANLTSGTVDTARLASGTANASTYLRGDQTWATIPASGNVSYDTATAATGFLALPTGTTAQRPGSPSNGYTRFNTTLNAIETYSSTTGKWEVVVNFTIPNAPTIGTASATGATTANVPFTAPTDTGSGTSTQGITSYTATSSPGGITATLSQSGSGTIPVTGLSSNTAYTFTVYATNAAGNSNASASSNSITTWTVPGAPTIGTATATGTGSATVSYTAPAFNGGTAITSYTATSSPGGFTGSLATAGSGTITVSGLSSNTAYTFTVTATNAVGTGSASAASNSITTWALPGAPTIGTASIAAGSTTASVPYTAPAFNGNTPITSYTATSSPGGITGTLSTSGSGTISVAGLSIGTTYTFTVTATNAVGTGPASAASNSITPNAPPSSVTYLVVAGGGGGGSDGGGGGAGGYQTSTLSVSTGVAYTVTVGGGGGAPGGGTGAGSSGSPSVFSSVTSTGGGGGGAQSGGPGQPGGSGGGGGNGGNPGAGSGTPGQGNPGGNGVGANNGANGGGGGVSNAGSGGSGGGGGPGGTSGTFPINGGSYAGGGGGGASNNAPGAGGSGGGANAGSGGNSSGTGGVAGANSGSGGGGGGDNGSVGFRGGAGGSGIVVVAYPSQYNNAASTTGSPTFTNSGGYKYYTWTSSGTITF